jgi:hypothetical protein
MIRFRNTAGNGIDCLSYNSGSRFNAKEFTVSAFVKRMGAGTTVSCGTSGQTAIEPIFTKGVGESETVGLNLCWFLGYIPTTNRFGTDMEDFNNGLNHPFNFTTTGRTTGIVYHVAVTYTTGDSGGSGRWSGYVNGIIDGTSGFAGTANVRTPDYTSRQGVGIGIALNSTSGRQGAFNGYIWDCAFWDTPLTSGEIYQLALAKQTYMPLQIRPQNLKAYYPLDETNNLSVVNTGIGFILDRCPIGGSGRMSGIATGYASDWNSYF